MLMANEQDYSNSLSPSSSSSSSSSAAFSLIVLCVGISNIHRVYLCCTAAFRKEQQQQQQQINVENRVRVIDDLFCFVLFFRFFPLYIFILCTRSYISSYRMNSESVYGLFLTGFSNSAKHTDFHALSPPPRYRSATFISILLFISSTYRMCLHTLFIHLRLKKKERLDCCKRRVQLFIHTTVEGN